MLRLVVGVLLLEFKIAKAAFANGDVELPAFGGFQQQADVVLGDQHIHIAGG